MQICILSAQITAYQAYEEVIGTAIQDLDDESLRVSEITNALASVAPLTDTFTGKNILSIDADVARSAIVDAEGGDKKAQYTKAITDIDA